jgi:hypothetical protein
MARFTLILEYGGGTYIRQVNAVSPQAALNKLATGTDDRRILFQAVAREKAVAIEGITNCWCSSASHRGKLGLVNIVKTVR